MGISGLLPLLAPIQKQVHLRELAGLTVAVDTYVWLHRGAFGCAMDLGLNKPTTAYIGFCMKRVALLKQFGIKPLLVFDGGCLPMKHHTEHGRRMRRKEAREKALEELSKGNAAKATEMFQQCVDITPNMAWELMKVLKKQGIEFIVAPYEADAQLVYLEKIKKVHAVLTEDSDLLVFGCQRLLLKLDAIGNAVEIRAKDFPHVPCMKRGWTFSKFRQACILSGCDYLPSLKGVGIKKAFDAMSHSSDAEKLLRMWRNFGYSMKAPPFRANYDSDFKQAELTFLYQRVYDPNLKKLVPLNEPTAEVGNLAEMSGFLGPDLEPAMAEGVATGLLNPYTLKPYSKDEEFAYNITVPPPSAPKPNKIQEKHQPIDLSSSSRILQTSITVSSNMNHSQLQHKLVTTSSASQYFPKPVSSILSLEPDVFQTPSPPESQSAFLNNISDADSCLESKPIHFSSSQFAKFINTTVSISDGFSYHQTAIRPHGKSEAIASCESENQSENKSPSPQSLKIFPHEPLLDPTHLGTSIQTRTLHSVSVSQEEECRFENACESNDKQRYQAEAEAANTSGSEKLTYMEWNYNYRPPTHSSQTRDYVGKSVVGSGLNHFKSRTQEQSLYSAAVGSVKRPLAGGGSGQKKRLGTGRPKNTSSIKDFFGKKG